MSLECALCDGPVNPYDESTWKEVMGWVGGPRKDSMRLRHDTGRYAHTHCVAKLQSGNDPASPDLFETALQASTPAPIDTLPFEVPER